MTDLRIGDEAPKFSLYANDGKQYSFKDFKNKKVILFFYPQDDTPTCTKQVCIFRDNLDTVKNHGAVIVGISPDNVKSHNHFASKYDLNFLILSDENKEVIKRYGVWKKKVMFGRKYMGVIRSTFIINEAGNISHIFSNVRLKNHIAEILKAITS